MISGQVGKFSRHLERTFSPHEFSPCEKRHLPNWRVVRAAEPMMQGWAQLAAFATHATGIQDLVCKIVYMTCDKKRTNKMSRRILTVRLLYS